MSKLEARIELGHGGGSGADSTIRQMRDKTQNDYFETMIKTLRMELMKEIAGHANDGSDVKEELNALDMLIK